LALSFFLSLSFLPRFLSSFSGSPESQQHHLRDQRDSPVVAKQTARPRVCVYTCRCVCVCVCVCLCVWLCVCVYVYMSVPVVCVCVCMCQYEEVEEWYIPLISSYSNSKNISFYVCTNVCVCECVCVCVIVCVVCLCIHVCVSLSA